MSDARRLHRCDGKSDKHTRNSDRERETQRTPTRRKRNYQRANRKHQSRPHLRLSIRGEITRDAGTERDRYPRH
jgi:hypothetical protein